MRGSRKTRTIAAGTALAMVLSLSACASGDDDNGDTGNTGGDQMTTTTVTGMETTMPATTAP